MSALDDIVRNLSNRIQEVDLKDSFANVSQGVPVYTTAGLPTAGQPGRVAYDSTIGALVFDNGTAWIANAARTRTVQMVHGADAPSGATVAAYYGNAVILPNAGTPICAASVEVPLDYVAGTLVIIVAVISSSAIGILDFNSYAGCVAVNTMWSHNIDAGASRSLTPTGIDFADFVACSYTDSDIAAGRPFEFNLIRAAATDPNTGVARVSHVYFVYSADM